MVMNPLSTQHISMLAEQPASWSMAARDIYPLICVRDPYFAFQTFDVASETVTSTVAPEHPLGDEVGPMAAAEAGRHLAILGSCAAAMVNPVRARHYYLAREAYLERTTELAPLPGPLHAHAAAVFSDKRSARAQCSIWSGADQLFSLDVGYSVLTEALFQRFYGKHATDSDNITPIQRPNPYRSAPTLEVLESDASHLVASLGIISKESCAGHFPRVPCLPVAALMHSLSRAAGALFVQRLGAAIKYTVEIAEVSARELAMAGARLQLDASYVGQHPRGDKFQVRATTDGGTLIGELGVVLAAHPRPSKC
jgi:hypothetical protein